MRVLALDSATEACSVALIAGDDLIWRRAESGRSNAPELLRMVQAVLAEAGLSLPMLDGLSASIGPGAFTGVRIAVSVAQGLAFGADLAVVPVTTLEALAFQLLGAGATRAAACLDARLGEVYWGCYCADLQRGVAVTLPPWVGPPENAALPPGTHRGIGRGFAAYPMLGSLPGLILEPEDCRALPNAREFARLGALRLGLGEGGDPAALTPLYLRDKVALTEAERARR
jgi:tRNA threonylcarbamoyladenosine biosynthesis protein TsaB